MTPITASTSATVSPNDNVESQSRNCDNGSIVFSLLKLWERQVCNPALPIAWIETAEIWGLVIRGPRKNFVDVFANLQCLGSRPGCTTCQCAREVRLAAFNHAQECVDPSLGIVGMAARVKI